MVRRFDPDEARLLGDVVKVRGRLSYEAGDPGTVEVRADCTFVYALEQVGGDRVDRTVVRRDLVMMAADPKRWQATEGRLPPKSYLGDFGNSACEVYDGCPHPSFAGTAATGAPATGAAVDPYDRSRPVTEHSGLACGQVTRT